MTDKKKLIKEFILKNPKLSGNECYKQTKNKGIGIRKTDFYALYREVKELPEPSIEKKEKSIPIKYKKVEIELPKVKEPKLKGQYGIIEVIDVDSFDSYWIKYKSRNDFARQFDVIKKSFKIVGYKLISHGVRNYSEFIEPEFKKLLENEGILS